MAADAKDDYEEVEPTPAEAIKQSSLPALGLKELPPEGIANLEKAINRDIRDAAALNETESLTALLYTWYTLAEYMSSSSTGKLFGSITNEQTKHMDEIVSESLSAIPDRK